MNLRQLARIKVVKSVGTGEPEEWQARVNLAACYRLTAMYGMTEMIANHISCRAYAPRNHFRLASDGLEMTKPRHYAESRRLNSVCPRHRP